MTDFDYDIVVRAERVVCPASGIDSPTVLAVKGGRIAAVGGDLPSTAKTEWDFPQGLLLPGLIDLHAHPAVEGSKYGVDPDLYLLPRGTTTVLSQGDAGAANWEDYHQTTIQSSKTRVRLALNLSATGESGPGGCFENLDDIGIAAAVDAVGRGGEYVWGIAVNLSRYSCGSTDPREVMKRALKVAEQTGKPLLFGMRERDDWPIDQQMELLRAGDVVTYCYRPPPRSILEGERVHPAVHAARQRGVLFDVGHGFASFSFPVARAALADGFAPDTISTDFYAAHVDRRPPHDLPRVMSMLLAAGMPEREVFRAVTATPARILGIENEIGCLTVGACADLTVLEYDEQAEPLTDTDGKQLSGGCWRAVSVIRAGQLETEKRK